MKVGIVICSRLDSSRVRNKPFQYVNGKRLIERLVDQLLPLDIPICIAVPEKDLKQYSEVLKEGRLRFYSDNQNSDDPLKRTFAAAVYYSFDIVIRITHDKIFIDTDALREAVSVFTKTWNKDDLYLYSSHLIDGTGFEIFSRELLERACVLFHNSKVEHISYAIKSLGPKFLDFIPTLVPRVMYQLRFLIDFEEDLDFIRAIYGHSNSKNPDLQEAIGIVLKFPFLLEINRQPLITVYTCAHNEEKFIKSCMDSVASQTIFDKIEYILIDDCSMDDTFKTIISSKLFSDGKIKVKRNETNLGLSSSSNIALNMARGKYIMRLDADDALLFPFSLEKMLKAIEPTDIEALYPTYIDDETKKYRDGASAHHVGGCLFLTKAIRNIQFTEKLRGWEGKDLFERAKDQMKIGYYDEMPTFFYRYRPNSMSRSNSEYRSLIKQQIEAGIKGDDLIGVPI